MAEADTLRLVAEVVDKFSAPMRNLRTQLQGMGKEGASHTDAVVKGFQKVEGAAKGASQVVTNTLNPALAAVGVTGLGVAAALTGIGASLRALGGSLASLGMLSRETGVSAENLRVIQGVMGKFGIESEVAAGAVKNFAQSMRLARDGIGPIMEFLRTQGRSAEGRKFFNDLADDLQRSKDNGEALTKALEALENIKDPAGRMEYAQRLFGNADIGRLGDQHLGKLREVIEQQRKLLGPLDEGAVKAAENFEKAMSSMRSTMQRLGTAIATEALPYISDFVKGLEGLVKGGREDVTGPLRESIRTVGDALREIDWKQAGKDAGVFIKDAGDGLKGILAVAKELAAIMRSLREGNVADATRRADGASGPLARRLAPQVGDDEIETREEVDRLRKLLAASREAQGSVIGRGQLKLGLLEDPEALARKLQEAEARLGTLRSRTPEQRQSDFDRETKRLADEMKRLREALPDKQPGQPTVQQQSFDAGDGQFGGARIYTAGYGSGGGSYGGLGAVGGMLRNRNGGIYAPRGGRGPASGFGEYGEDLPGGQGAPRSSSGRQQPLERRGFGGGRFNGLGPGMVPQPRAGGPGERVRRFQRGEPEAGPQEGANPGDYKDVLDYIAKAEGTAHRSGGGYDTSLAYGKFLPGGREQTLTDKTLDEIDALQTHMLRDPKNPYNSSAIGRYQIVRKTLRGLRKKLGLKGDELYDQAMQDRLAAELARARGADPVGLGNEWASLKGRKGQEAAELMRRVPRTATTIPRERPSRETADGQGFAARQRAMREFERGEQSDRAGAAFAEAYRSKQAEADRKQKEMFGGDAGRSLTERAMRSPIMSGKGGDVNGSVQVTVMKPGPDTKVNTAASGNLFRDVQVRRGATMAAPSEDI